MALFNVRHLTLGLHRNLRCSTKLLPLKHERSFTSSQKVHVDDAASSGTLPQSERTAGAGQSLFLELSSLGSVETALEAINQREFSGNEASIAVRALRHIQKNDSSNPDIATDQRFNNLAASIIEGIKNLSNESLTSTLANAFHVNSSNDEFILALEGECRRRLRLLPIRSVATIVCNDQLLSKRMETKALVIEAARVLELRWRELQNPQLVRRLLPSAARVSEPLLERVEDKTLEMLSQFTFQDITALMKSMVATKTRSLPILRAISYQLLEQRSQWEIPAMIDIMSAMGNLGFHNPALVSEFAVHIQQRLDECSLSLLCDIAKTYAVLRIQATSLLDSIHNVAAAALEELTILDLKRLLFAYSQFSYQPPDPSTFYAEVGNKLDAKFDEYSVKDQIDVAHSLTVLKQVPHKSVARIVKHVEESQDDPLQVTHILKLLQINAYSQLDFPQYEGPYLTPEMKSFPEDHKLYTSTLHRSLFKVLRASLGDDLTMVENVKSDLGYIIDAEISSKLKGNGKKLAIVTFSPPSYLYSTRQLVGRLEMMLGHLELAGYQVLQISYHDWYPLRTPVQQVNFLKDKLKEILE
ncbi:FAST kinase domain-containing protein 4-like [Lytechinus pictus]|uniref:FAST kinase domain-containing protein 4-like n=1 Tax=Lytechinus pictus TaxID=7653 RepID=UPI0030BA1C45